MNLIDYIRESNAIEGIEREPTAGELTAHWRFLSFTKIGVYDLEVFVHACQPGAKLRRRTGMNVRVGKWTAPLGGDEIYLRLQSILQAAPQQKPYHNHLAYEKLHPFQDCNGRSGRALWLWQMGGIKNLTHGFLQTFYYQTLRES